MIAVSNTTPLRYLIAIDQEQLLGKLFEKVFVPAAVHSELTEARTPEIVRRRILALPGWRFGRWKKRRQPSFRSPYIEANARPFCSRKRSGRMCF
jgi:hypothetical protein